MKRSEAARYASWSALIALLLASITGGIYLRRQWIAHVERKKAPPPLAANQERQSIGMTLSNGEGEHTIFTVHASKSTDLKGEDISLLEDVIVTVYGKLGDRHDVIHSRSCRYAKNTGGIECSGEVQIDLQTASDAAHVKEDARAKPNIVRVETDGVTFDKRTGKAFTSRPVRFAFQNGDGDGVGAAYFSQQGILRLEKDVRITMHQTGPLAVGKKTNAPTTDVILHGTSLEMGKQLHRVVLAGPATADTPTQRLSAGQLTMVLDAQNRTQQLLAEPGALNQTPQLVSTGGKAPTGSGTLQADLMTADLTPEGWIRTVSAQGNVWGKSETGEMQADRGDAEMWPRVNQTKVLTLRGNVHLTQVDAKTGTQKKLATTVLQMDFAGGKLGEPNPMQHAQTLARGTMEWNDTTASQSKLTADQLAVDFGAAGKAKDLVATGNVETERKLQGKPTQLAMASHGDAQLDANGSWKQIHLQGNVLLKDGDHRAESQKAVFERVPQVTVLTGQAIARDAGSETRANKITFNQDTGDVAAEGNVRSTDFGNSKDSIRLSPSPSNISSEYMLGNSKTGRALYTGHCRLWQGQSVLEADSIELFRLTRVLNANGNVRAVFPKQQSDQQKTKESSVWHISSGMLTYWDAENRAHLEKDVVVQSENERMRGPILDLFFTRELDPKNGNQTTSKISRAVGTGGVEVVQGEKRGIAEKGVYTADDDKFVLSGGTPTLYDEDGGMTTGRELTFNIADDTIIVNSGNGPRTLTKHRVQ